MVSRTNTPSGPERRYNEETGNKLCLNPSCPNEADVGMEHCWKCRTGAPFAGDASLVRRPGDGRPPPTCVTPDDEGKPCGRTCRLVPSGTAYARVCGTHWKGAPGAPKPASAGELAAVASATTGPRITPQRAAPEEGDPPATRRPRTPNGSPRRPAEAKSSRGVAPNFLGAGRAALPKPASPPVQEARPAFSPGAAAPVLTAALQGDDPLKTWTVSDKEGRTIGRLLLPAGWKVAEMSPEKEEPPPRGGGASPG